MKAFKAILMTVMLGAAMSATAQVTNQLFDKGWTFTQNGQSISVDLPHDWDIYTSPAPKVGATGTGGGWYQAGKGEYRKTFKTPAGELVKLHFEGVYQKAEIFINGQKAGQHAYGYTPFTTWKGRALIVLRSAGKKGKADLTVASTLPAAKLSLQVQ